MACFTWKPKGLPIFSYSDYMARLGMARPGMAGRGKARVIQTRIKLLPKERGLAWHGMAWLGAARQGNFIQTTRRGMAGPGPAWHGAARQGNFTTEEKMTSSNRLKSVVSSDRMQAIAQSLTVSTRKPSIKKVSLLRGHLLAKPFLNGSLNVQPTEEATTFQSGGGRYDCKRISTLQSSKIQSGCEDSNSEGRFSLQVQYQLPHYMDSEVSEEVACGEGS